MNTPWIIGTLLAIAFFAVFEARAFRHPDRQNTLSRFVWFLGQKFPLSIFIMGMFAGGLAVHFFWHWCPDQGLGTGFMWPPVYKQVVPPGCRADGPYTVACPAVSYYAASNGRGQ